jgi:hypothetical protein
MKHIVVSIYYPAQVNTKLALDKKLLKMYCLLEQGFL